MFEQATVGRVGLMVVGHNEYWNQFPSARPGQLSNAAALRRLIASHRVEVVTFQNAGGDEMVDSPELAFEAGEYFRSRGIDVLFLLLHAYEASGRYMIGLKRVGCPIVTINYQAQTQWGFVTLDESMRLGGFCGLAECIQAMRRCGIEPADTLFGRFYPETDTFDEVLGREVGEWCRVAGALRALRGKIFGSLGHNYEGMLDMNFDPTAFTRSYGIHIRYVEMCELVQYVQDASGGEVTAKMDEMAQTFEYADASYDPTTRSIQGDDVPWAARCAVGLGKLIANNNLSGMAYYYEGRDNLYERVASNLIIGNTLLTSRGCSLAGEHDMKTCVAMYIMSALGCGGSFAENGGLDWENNDFLVGHDGPHDIRIAQGKPLIRALSLYHGKRGHGISVEFSLRQGPMTMLGTAVDVNGQFGFRVAEVQSVGGRIPQTGNTWTRAHVSGSGRDFVVNWVHANNNHHFALSVGHNYALIQKLGKCLGIPVEKVE